MILCINFHDAVAELSLEDKKRKTAAHKKAKAADHLCFVRAQARSDIAQLPDGYRYRLVVNEVNMNLLATSFRCLSCLVLSSLLGCSSSSNPGTGATGGQPSSSAGSSLNGGSSAAGAGNAAAGNAEAGNSGAGSTGPTIGGAGNGGSVNAGGGNTGTGNVGGTAAGAGTGSLGGIAGSAGSAGSSGAGGASAFPPLSKYIVVDQFGYLTGAEKIAVLRDPQVGYDATESYTPGTSYAVVDAATGTQLMTGAATPWNAGATDASSGDKAWWFDFSSVTTPGSYYVLDVNNNVRSPQFKIDDTVYRDVLKQAVRMFFYQRVGQDKSVANAGVGWADGPSHVGANQDHACRRFLDPNNPATAKDLWGGWYDAGDFNKYTSWTATYVITLLRAYEDNPTVWRDDTNIPESGNGVPDVVDEAKWGLDYLVRLQNADGSVLSIVGEDSASPPSSASKPSYYGDANTSATLAAAAAYAYGAKVLSKIPLYATFAGTLGAKAASAWTWADANPAVIFKNNDSASGTSGLGSGQQEVDDYGRMMWKIKAATYLFENTGTAAYKTYVEANYAQITPIKLTWTDGFNQDDVDVALYYARLPGVTATVAADIRSKLLTGIKGQLANYTNKADPYCAFMKDYVWGSNSTKAGTGDLIYEIVLYNLDAASTASATKAAATYLHYLHGVNPFQLVYLSNMNAFGATNSVSTFYHSWFADGSAKWDQVGVSTYGPPPGFLPGGPNPSYTVDSCCPAGCGSVQNNALCTSISVVPPTGQPAQKSYKEFNNNWPLDSWQVTEPSDGYQVPYIRLLSKFVK